MSVHNTEGEVEGPHFVEDRVTDIENDCVHAWVEENRPEVAFDVSDVDEIVDETQEEESEGCSDRDEGERPHVLVDWDEAVVDREKGEDSGESGESQAPEDPPTKAVSSCWVN
jgi:hypothetical protein